MKYFLDTEFNEYQGAFISMGIVAENNYEIYFECLLQEPWKPWVRANVYPLLTGPVLSPEDARNALQIYFAGDNAPVIITDWPADIAHLCNFLDRGEGRRMGASRWEFILQGQIDCKPLVPHHALSDAKALKEAWEKKYGK